MVAAQIKNTKYPASPALQAFLACERRQTAIRVKNRESYRIVRVPRSDDQNCVVPPVPVKVPRLNVLAPEAVP